VRGQGQTRALQLAAKKAHSKALAGLLPRGVAIHNAELSMADRALVEELFLERHVLVLCSTCTLAMGVNLPAHMVSRAAAGGRQARGCARAPAGRPGANATAGPVPPPQVVIKGTRMYAGDKGTYEDYDTSMINQMAGRAGRPDFDTQGVCVIMTAKSDSRRIEARARGSEVLESHLRGNLCEVLNSEVRRAGGEGRWARGAARAARQAGRRTPPPPPPPPRAGGPGDGRQRGGRRRVVPVFLLLPPHGPEPQALPGPRPRRRVAREARRLRRPDGQEPRAGGERRGGRGGAVGGAGARRSVLERDGARRRPRDGRDAGGPPPLPPQLCKSGLVEEAGAGALRALEPGKLMSSYYVAFRTMSQALSFRGGGDIPSVLRLLASSHEFGEILLRRNEKRPLNDLNKAPGRLRFNVQDPSRPGKPLNRIQSAADKFVILTSLGECAWRPGSVPGAGQVTLAVPRGWTGGRAAEAPSRMRRASGSDLTAALSDVQEEKVEWQLKKDMELILKTGSKLCQCFARLYQDQGRLGLSVNCSLLARCLQHGQWETSAMLTRQAPRVGVVRAARLADKGVHTLRCVRRGRGRSSGGGGPGGRGREGERASKRPCQCPPRAPSPCPAAAGTWRRRTRDSWSS